MKKRIPIIVANWKMVKTAEESSAFIQQFYPLVKENLNKKRVFIAPSFTALHAASVAAKGSFIQIGAQNMYFEAEGAFTGEISSKMLKEAGAEFVLLGHSERRHLFGENNALVNKKVHRALKEELVAILCVGETLKEREEGRTEAVLTTQLKESLAGIRTEQIRHLIIAYEPVWAIGTGVSATAEMAQHAHLLCRECLGGLFGKEGADKLSILYGGSVKAEVMQELMQEPDIDGVLVGGASLNPETFAQIVNKA